MCKRRIGVIAATENEISPFFEKLTERNVEKKAMLHFHIGTYKDIEIVAVYCGVCKVNAAIAMQILISDYHITQAIMIGVAGAIDESLEIADTVVANEVGYHDVAAHILTEYHPWMETVYFFADEAMRKDIMAANSVYTTIVVGKVVTGEAFIDQDGREEIIKNHKPLAVDMETASVAHVCYANNIPFAAIRSVSDTPHESGNVAFEKNLKQAAEKTISVLENYLQIL